MELQIGAPIVGCAGTAALIEIYSSPYRSTVHFLDLLIKCESPRSVAIFHTCMREYRTPRRFSIAALSRSFVHLSALKPSTLGECRNAAAIHESVAGARTGELEIVGWFRRAVSRSAKPRSIVICLTYTREKSMPNRFWITD